ncbi:hypothetical protein K3718_10015 [Leisingera aquaemixtae]|uniref:site-specific DNA-methyltransferase (adenine-specific) n=1 Tax=Leisingera aquaemixtae TaxID=1396826 RepID=A0ABY5WEN1_9RHOB|nr:hypothetical protein [Leisingera aquaemixtae]UWQ39923.1 hypothetical protein K3718_10015 [Leisingera aquaemixtae]
MSMSSPFSKANKMNFSGIENENEFFPSGAFADDLAEEFAALAAGWPRGAENPLRRIKAVADPWQRMIERTLGDPRARDVISAREKQAGALLEALGYEVKRDVAKLDSGQLVPVLTILADADHRSQLWIIETPIPEEDLGADPLSVPFVPAQVHEEDRDKLVTEKALEDLLGDEVFGAQDAPRYVLVMGPTSCVLARRDKWPSRSVLRFDLIEILTTRNDEVLTAFIGLIGRKALVPRSGTPMLEVIEEEAQRRANAVTSSLKATVREAIEILGTEVLKVTENKLPPGKYPEGYGNAGTWITGDILATESLRMMYRLLFLFYAEANPRLGIFDMKNPIYRTGYSLEALRELESVRLRTKEEKEGTYLWQSLTRLLDIIWNGVEHGPMPCRPVRVSLLDPESTPLLNRVMPRNEAVQEILRALSLKKTRSGTNRISYAQLGIGQLGAVYETLISFTGTVAKEPMLELVPDAKVGKHDLKGISDDPDEARDDKEHNPLEPAWFVPKSRADEFSRPQIRYHRGHPVIHERGSFTYRLAGRDRQKSASYYTPEPLARLLVQHTLEEACKPYRRPDGTYIADKLLELKILEPAMGSAAFLVETVNQLADMYLEAKQAEIGRTIPQDDYEVEKRRVRAYIADRNCFGVDLNPIAVELGAISLWLNSLHSGSFSPWFGDQLHAGNSLIGARRAAYDPKSLKAKKKGERWFELNPQELRPNDPRPKGHVWQFLLPAEGMVPFDKDKSIADLLGDAQQKIKEWRTGPKGAAAKKAKKESGDVDWLDPMSNDEVAQLQRLSSTVDDLFDQVADQLRQARAKANDQITLWPETTMPGATGLSYKDKIKDFRVLTGVEHVANSLPYQRLKTAMDMWCALFTWPLDKVDLLPSRFEWIMKLDMILTGGQRGGALNSPEAMGFSNSQLDLVDRMEPGEADARAGVMDLAPQGDMIRETDVDALVATTDWVKVAVQVAAKERFTHFDLIFADLLRDRNGFDVIVGNPPWARPSWDANAVHGELDPGFLAMGLSASDGDAARKKVWAGAEPHRWNKPEFRRDFLSAYVSAKGGMEVTGDATLFPFAGGGANNLYRCFIDLAFRLTAPLGAAGLIHQDGHLSDPGSGEFRSHWYGRTVRYFEFRNQIKRKMFAEVDNNIRFSLNVYRGSASEPSFEAINGAFLSTQVEESYRHDGYGEVYASKNAEGNWDTRGHLDRVVPIDHAALTAIHELAEGDDSPVMKTRFIQPYSRGTMDVFSAFARAPKLSSSIKTCEVWHTNGKGEQVFDSVPGWHMAHTWNETTSQKDGSIRRETAFRSVEETILQGPLFHVGNPVYKSPRQPCISNKSYDVLDLSALPEDYIQRSNYGPALDMKDFRARITKCRFDPTRYHTDFYRVAFRNMVALNGERSLIGALIPPGMTHIHGVKSFAFRQPNDLLNFHACSLALPLDMRLKAGGKQNAESELENLPFPALPSTAKHRALRLACLTRAYAPLWEEAAPGLTPLPWSLDDPRLPPVDPGPTWSRDTALRTDFARRMALVEIDVLVARALGLTLEQLQEIYRIYFPVLQENEQGTWYDRNGRIVWTCSKGLPGVGWLMDGKSPGRAAWDKKLESNPQVLRCTAIDDTQPGGPREVERVFEGPFETCDRAADYARAWAHFDELEGHA